MQNITQNPTNTNTVVEDSEQAPVVKRSKSGAFKAKTSNRRMAVLTAIYEADGRRAIVDNLPTTKPTLLAMERDGLIKRKSKEQGGKRLTGSRGKPADYWFLTDKGRSRASRHLSKTQQANATA